MLMSKINFKKQKKYYFNIFLNKKYFKNYCYHNTKYNLSVLIFMHVCLESV